MKVLLTDSFVLLPETTGTIQNVCDHLIEISTDVIKDNGIFIKPYETYSFHNIQLYVRCCDGTNGYIRVVPFEAGSEGGDRIDFSLDQLGTTFINNFTFSALAYPNTADPQLDGKPVLVMAVKDNNDKSQDVKYVFANLESLMVHYEDFAGAGASAAGMSGIVPAPQVGDQNKFLCGNGTWETVSTSLGGISLTLGNVPTFKIRSDNGVEFAADLYPVTDTLIGDTLYFDKHIFQFTGLSSGLTLHDSNFYAASDSACENSFGSIVAAPNDYSFYFGSKSAFGVADGGVISVTQLDSNHVNLSLNLDALNTGDGTPALWGVEDQAGGIYTYTSSTATTHYLKQGSASYTYSLNGITNDTAQSFDLGIAQVTNINTTGRNATTNKNTLKTNGKLYEVLSRYVQVDEIRDTTGNITEFVITILNDTALKTGNTWAGSLWTATTETLPSPDTVGTDWVSEVTVDFGNATNPPKYTINLANDVATNYRGAHNDGKLELVSGGSDTYTFTTDEFIEGFASTQNGENTYITTITPPSNKANGDYCTISGLASDLKLQKTADYKYNIYKVNPENESDKSNVVGTIDGHTITLTKKAALKPSYDNETNFTVELKDRQAGRYDYILELGGTSGDADSFYSLLNPTGEIKERFEYTAANGNEPATFTYKTGTSKDKFVDNPREYEINGVDDTYANSYTFVKGKETVGDSALSNKLKLTGSLNVAGNLEVQADYTLYCNGTTYGKIDFENKTVTLNWYASLNSEVGDTVKVIGDNDYTISEMDIWQPPDVVSNQLATNPKLSTAGFDSGYQWDEDRHAAVYLKSNRGQGFLYWDAPTKHYCKYVASTDEILSMPYITQEEYNTLTAEEQADYESFQLSSTTYYCKPSEAIKVGTFISDTITINHTLLDNRSFDSPIYLVNTTSTYYTGDVKLAIDSKTTATLRTFANETFTAGVSAGTYTYAALSSTEGWSVSGDEHQILSVELEGKTFTLNNLRTDLGNIGFDSKGYIHATNGSTIGRMGGTTIKLFDTAVHKLATPTITGTDAADFTLILPT